MEDHRSSLVSQKSSDSGLHIQLHPLILLTISDHITRHAARGQQGPIIGALLGQQNGRQITLEHAFECIVIEGPNGEAQLSQEWFVERVKQRRSHSTYVLSISNSYCSEQSRMSTKSPPSTSSAGGQQLPRLALTSPISPSIAKSSKTTTNPPCSSRSIRPRCRAHPQMAQSYHSASTRAYTRAKMQ